MFGTERRGVQSNDPGGKALVKPLTGSIFCVAKEWLNHKKARQKSVSD